MACGNLPCSLDIVGCLRLLREDGLCYCISPGKHKDKLRWKMEALRNLRLAIGERVDREEVTHPRTTRKPEVVSWMGSVDSLDAEVSDLLKSLARRKSCLFLWRCSCKSDHELGKAVAEALEQIEVLMNQQKPSGEILVMPHTDLESNIESLKNEMATLKSSKEDLINKVQLLEVQKIGMKRTSRVKNWIEDAVSIEQKVNKLIGDTSFPGQSQASSSNQPIQANNTEQSLPINKDVAHLLEEVRNLTGRKPDKGDDLVHQELPDAVELVEISSTSKVGGETVMSMIQNHLLNDNTGIIGLHGMGGIGKTTILANLNNKYLANNPEGFDLVIWVTVSKELSPLNIRKTISERLGMKIEEGKPVPSASDIRYALSKKRFLLMLDDLWERINLPDLGVPFPNPDNGCKVILTTRYLEVCRDMDAEPIKVDLLNDQDSSILFVGKLGKEVDVRDPVLKPLIERVIRKCGGLPLALTTVARAMADATTREEWERAIRALNRSPTEIRGMESSVFASLKFSFDRLEEESTKACFLSCSWFPEDYEIKIELLINIWFAEGLLHTPGQFLNIHEARDRGHFIIKSLKHACFLEEGIVSAVYVKLHDVIREMASWLLGTGKHLWINDASQLSREMAISDTLERLRLRRFGGTMPLKPNFPNLKTMIISRRELPPIDFHTMPNLRFLRLKRVGNLTVQRLESICQLSELRFLSLRRSFVECLPKEFGRLTKLKQMELINTEIKEIPKEAFSTLVNLESLNMAYSGFRWKEGRDKGSVSLGDLEGLEKLSELDLQIAGAEGFETYSRSKKLIKSTSFLHVMDNDMTKTLSGDLFENMTRLTNLLVEDLGKLQNIVLWRTTQLAGLKELELLGLESLERIDFGRSEGGAGTLLPNLSSLKIVRCGMLKDLKWARQLPSLEYLYVQSCCRMVELFGGGEGPVSIDYHVEDHDPLIPRLRTLSIRDMDVLSSISDQAPSLPTLENLEVAECPQLEKLPLGTQSTPRLSVLLLQNMQGLCSISDQTLLFPSLEYLIVENCPQLKKLPLGPQSASNLKTIRCDKEWFGELEWEDQALKSRLQRLIV